MTQPDPLDDFFAAGRADRAQPDAALMARIMADAEGEIALRAAPAPKGQASAGDGWVRSVLRGIGGWPALAGLATATAAGVWIGVALPDVASPFAAGSAYDLNDLLPGYGTELLVEG